MKTLVKVLALAMVVSLLVAGNAMALPALWDGYHWANNQTWTVTDLTTNQNGSADFALILEKAAFESDFGLYTDGGSTKFEIFSYNEEPLDFQTVYFKQDAGAWSVSKNNTNWTSFDNEFGFYFGIHTGGQNDPTANYYLYSENALNADKKLHVAVQWDGIENVGIMLEDVKPLGLSDKDYDDMVIRGHDVAPTPEPGTIILLGAGLAGLVAFRKKFRK